MTETREHRVQERLAGRRSFNRAAERGSLFTVAHLCSQKVTVRRAEKKEKMRKRWRDRVAQSGGIHVLKLGPLHSSITESLEGDNGLEGVIKREREGEKEKKRAGK